MLSKFEKMVENLNVTAHATMTVYSQKHPPTNYWTKAKKPKGILVFSNTGQKETSTHDVHLTNRDREQLIKAELTESTTQTPWLG